MTADVPRDKYELMQDILDLMKPYEHVAFFLAPLFALLAEASSPAPEWRPSRLVQGLTLRALQT